MVKICRKLLKKHKIKLISYEEWKKTHPIEKTRFGKRESCIFVESEIKTN